MEDPTTQLILTPDSENKYEALARKLQTQESEGVKSSERAENVEVKFMDIEDELKVVGQNQQTLEVTNLP